jgi:hypothetical protein
MYKINYSVFLNYLRMNGIHLFFLVEDEENFLNVRLRFINEYLMGEDSDFKEQVEYAANMDARQMIIDYKQIAMITENYPGSPAVRNEGGGWLYCRQSIDYFAFIEEGKAIRHSDERYDLQESINKTLSMPDDDFLRKNEDCRYFGLVTELKTGIQEANWVLKFEGM